MIPAPFDYRRPATLEDALDLLARYGEEARLLAGGHSLIPAMKLRLARPRVLIDIGRLGELRYLRETPQGLAIGALTTHVELETSPLVAARCPLLAAVAARIGDVQVRNKGTIGGSLAHADPAADWPAAVLALDGELEIAGRQGRRVVAAREFFVDLFQTALGPGEVLCEIRVPATAPTVSYAKFAQKASGFAVAGVAAVVDVVGRRARIGVTGIAPTPYRAVAVERALEGTRWTPADLAAAAEYAAQDVEPLGDLHASAEFRAHLARVLTRRALLDAVARAS